MILLDTDALSHLQKQDPVGQRIEAALSASPDRVIWISVVSAYEILNGAVAWINRQKARKRDLVPEMRLLQESVEFLATWQGAILSYDHNAEAILAIFRSFPPRLRQQLKQDAQIAATALAHGASVWTCNVADYAQVPGLSVVQARTGARIP